MVHSSYFVEVAFEIFLFHLKRFLIHPRKLICIIGCISLNKRILRLERKTALKGYETDSLAEDLNAFFDRILDVERIKVRKRQTIDTLISEEALQLAKYLRNERMDWIPRIPIL